MAPLYPENTQYINNSGSDKFPTLSATVKNSVNSQPSNTPYVPEYATSQPNVDISAMYRNLQAPAANTAIEQPASTSTEPLPAGYSSKILPAQSVAGNYRWNTPSTQTQIKNWPSSLGGGQYLQDPTQPGAIIKSARGTETPIETALLRGGMSKYYAQVDHIIPLWLGGADTNANKEVLSTIDHTKKTKAEGVALTLLTQGKIDTNQARLMSQNWKNLDTSNVPMPDKFGFVTGLSSDQIDSMTSGPNEDAYYKALGMDPTASKVNKQWDFDVQHPAGYYGHSFGDSVKAVWKEIPEALNNWLNVPNKEEHPIAYALEKPISEFGKGLIEGVSAGIINAAPEQDTGGFFGKSERIVGNVLGSLIPFGLAAKGLAWTGRVLGEIPALAKAFGAPTAITEALPWLGKVGSKVEAVGSAGVEATEGKGLISKTGEAISNTFKKLPGAEGVTRGLSKAGDFFSKINNFGKVAATAEDTSAALSKIGELGAEDIPLELKTQRGFLNMGNKVNAGLFFGSYALATQIAREGLGVEDQKSFYDHAKNFVTNAITGGVFEGAGQDFRGYAKLAGTSMAMGAINGESPDDILAGAITMVGLHGMGNEKLQRLGLSEKTGTLSREEGPIKTPSTPQGRIDALADNMDKTATSMAKQVLNKWVPETISNTDGKVKYTPAELQAIQGTAIMKMTEASYKENWAPEEVSAEMNRINGSIRQLDKGGMGKIVRNQADIADIKSTAQNLTKSKITRSITGGTIPDALREQYSENTPFIQANFTKDMNGRYVKNDVSGDFILNSGPTDESSFFPIVGTSSKINGGEKYSNIERYRTLMKEGKASGRIVLVDRGADYLNYNKLLNETVKPGEIQEDTGTPYVPMKNPQNTIEAFGEYKLPNGKTDWLSLGFGAREWKIDSLNENVQRYKRKNKPDLTTYDSHNNKDSVSEGMRTLGLKTLEGQITPLLTDPIGKTRIASAPENHIRIMITDSHIKNSIKINGDYNNSIGGKIEPTTPVTPTAQPPLPLATTISEAAKKQPVVAPQQQETTNVPSSEIKAPVANPVAVETTEKAPISKKKEADPSQFIQNRKGQEGVNALAASEITDSKKQTDFTRAKLTELAKKVSNEGKTRQDVTKGWQEFLDTFTKNIQKASGNESFKVNEGEDTRLLKKLYTSLAKSGTRPDIVFNQEGISLKEGAIQNTGKIDLLTKEFNQKNGLPEDAMSIAHVSDKNNYQGVKGAIQSVNKFDTLVGKMSDLNGEKYLPVGITGKGLENTIFVKYEPKMVERFDSDPSKYQQDGEKITNPDDKFIKAYMVDVLGLPKETQDIDLVKRANLIYHRYDQYHGPDQDINLRILKANKIGDEPSFKASKDQFETPDSKETKASLSSLNEGKIEDGPIYMGEDAFNNFIKGLNYKSEEHQGTIKALIDSSVDGKKVYHKGQFTKIDDAIRSHLKESYGIDAGKNDVISFDSNAKLGPKTGDFKIPLADIYAKPRSTTDSVSRVSPSYGRKFLSTDTGVKADTLEETNKNVKDLQDFNDALKNSKNKTEFEAAFDKYSQRFGLNKENLFQGAKGESFNLGAAKNNLSFETGKILKNLLNDAVMTPEYKKSAIVTINSPIKMAFDGIDKPNRYVNDKEIVLGKEGLNKIGVKEGDSVLVHRDPSYDINNNVILKVVDGSKLGNTSLSREAGIVSPFNERIILQGDQDADTMHVTKIGEGGIPQSEANAIKARGSKATPFTEVTPSKTDYVTAKNIQGKIKDQLNGDDQTSWISTQARIMDEVKDNNITVKVYPSVGGNNKSKFEILSNGKIVDTGFTSKSPVEFTATPQWGEKERQLISQAQRAAVDSKKSKDIYNMTERNNSVWAVKNLWASSDGNMTDIKAHATQEALRNIQKPYGIKKMVDQAMSIDDIFQGKEDKKTGIKNKDTGLAATIDYYNKLKEAGTELTPTQEKILAISKINPFNISEKVVKEAHKAGINAVKESFGDKYNPENAKLKKIKAVATVAKSENLKRGATKGERDTAKMKVENFFIKNLENGNYSEGDIDQIAYWAATDKLANISQFENFNEPKYIYLYRDLINASPKVAKAYYEGSESYEEPKKDGTGGPGPSKFTNLINNMKSKQGKIVVIARHGSTNSNGDNVFRGWKETEENQLTGKGINDAEDLGHSIKKLVGKENPNNFIIVSSDLNRAIDTAKKVSKLTGISRGKEYKDLRSQDTGDFTGKKESEVKDQIEANIEKTPDKPLPGASECYNKFIDRIKNTLKPNGEIEKDYPNKKIIVVTHHQVLVLKKNNFDRATEPMFQKGVQPGGFEII